MSKNKLARSIIIATSFYLLLLFFSPTQSQGQQGTFSTLRDLSYAANELASNKLDLYLPNGASEPTPLIVWIHGGGWSSGDKTLGQNSFQLQFARNGFAVASINYRLSGEAIFPAQIHDCKAAIRWLRANSAQYNIDPLRIGVWGSSAGGHLAALLGSSNDVVEMEGTIGANPMYSSRVQAVVDWYGPTDFLQMDTQALNESNCQSSSHNSANSAESRLVGCPIQTCPDAVQRANPLTYLSDDDPPFLIQHGTADCTVSSGQSRILFELMQASNHTAAYFLLNGAGHGGTQFSSSTNVEIVAEFLNTSLRLRNTAPAVLTGRILSPSGLAVRNAKVTLLDPQGVSRSVTTSSFGVYQFQDLDPGDVFSITVSNKRYRFAPKSVQVVADLHGLDLIGLE